MGSIWELGDPQLTRAQAKITYLGVQTKSVPTVVFGVEGHKVAMVRFLSVQRAGKPYDNDELPYTKSFSVSSQELRRIMSALRPIVTAINEPEGDFLSFSVLTGAGDSIVGEEFLIPRSRGKQFYTALLDSLSEKNSEGRLIVGQQFKNVYPE
jgi:hypothetical protein